MIDLISARKKVNGFLSDMKVVKKQRKEERVKLAEAKNRLNHIQEAQEITQQVAQTVQQKAHNRITAVVCLCLEAIFPDANYGFKINFERKRSRTEAKLILTKDGHEISDPLNADSGGVLDVSSFALRLSGLLLTKPKLRRLLVLDEPFKNVSENYRENMRNLITKLSKDFGVQIIMVTHESAYEIGKVVRL